MAPSVVSRKFETHGLIGPADSPSMILRVVSVRSVSLWFIPWQHQETSLDERARVAHLRQAK